MEFLKKLFLWPHRWRKTLKSTRRWSVSLTLVVEDERVKAVFAMNPLASHIFAEAGLQTLEAPVMLVAGTNDFLTPALLEQIQPFNYSQPQHLGDCCASWRPRAQSCVAASCRS